MYFLFHFEYELSCVSQVQNFLFNLFVVLGDEGSKSLIALGMATDKPANSIGRGSLVKLSAGVNVGDVDLDTTEVIGGQDAVGPRAVIDQVESTKRRQKRIITS